MDPKLLPRLQMLVEDLAVTMDVERLGRAQLIARIEKLEEALRLALKVAGHLERSGLRLYERLREANGD